MRKIFPAVIAMVVAFGLFNPASTAGADTRTDIQYYGHPLQEMRFRMNGLETQADVTIEDDMRWNVAGYYVFEQFGCTGGGYGGGSCSTNRLGSGYFCRYKQLAVPEGSTALTVSVVSTGLNKLYCGSVPGATKGRASTTFTFTPESGGGGCAMAPAYRKHDVVMVPREARKMPPVLPV